VILDRIGAYQRGEALLFDAGLFEAASATLRDADGDPAFAAEALVLPSEAFIADQMAVVDPDAVHAVRDFLRLEIGTTLSAMLQETYERLADDGPYRIDGASIGRRSLRNTCLSYLAVAGREGVVRAKAQFDAATNMTDMLAALGVLAASDSDERVEALAAFHAKWRGDDLVIDKWFSIQAMSPRAETIAEVHRLAGHADFDLRNPNRMRSLVGAFAMSNQVRFHDAGGAGYRFLADMLVALDPINSQTAARLVDPLGAWRRQDDKRAALMRAELERMLALPKLSRGTYEKVSKALALS
jgi:aminopeptidase N